MDMALELQDGFVPGGSRPEVVEHASKLASALREHAQATHTLVGLLRDPYLMSMIAVEVDDDAWKWIWETSRFSDRVRRREMMLAEELEAFYPKRSR